MEAASRGGFNLALKVILAERILQVCTHPTFADLESYHHGFISTARRESVAEHLALCEPCTLLLLHGVIRLEDNGDRAEPADAEFEEFWDRLRRRLPNEVPTRRPLASLIEVGLPSPEQALQIALETSEALAEMHTRGRVLNDLRAENVLIDPSGRIRLLDVGLAPTLDSFEIGYGRSAESAVSDLFCTLAPEQINREGLSRRSNLFSFGVLLYRLFTGVSPFREATPLETASRIVSLVPPRADEVKPEVEPAVADLIDRLLAKKPEDRPPSAKAVTDEIRSILRGAGLTQEGEGRLAPPPSIEERIERLYDEIIALTRAAAAAGSKDKAHEIEGAYARLRELQTAEAERHREMFEASLAMPIDAGDEILSRARDLREKIEKDLAASDDTARVSNRP